jgi:hypothetical protein
LIHPVLVLGFSTNEDAKKAFEQHICLCRNEDILLPDRNSEIKEIPENEFNKLEGFELIITDADEGFMVGYNRFNDFEPMYGRLEITDGAIREEPL